MVLLTSLWIGERVVWGGAGDGRQDRLNTVSGFARTSWRTAGAVCERVVVDVLDSYRLCGPVDIGVDEISW